MSGTIVISCDGKYYDKWGEMCIKSIQHYNPWINIICQIINPEESKCAPLEGVGYTYDWLKPDEVKDPVGYYQAARFKLVGELFNPDALVMTIDVDTVCTRSFTEEEFTELASQISVLKHPKSGHWLAGLVTYGNTGEFREQFADYLNCTSPDQWVYGLDQAILDRLSMEYDYNVVEEGTWMSIGKGPGVFLTLKGNQKESEKWLAHYNKVVNTINEDSSNPGSNT